jgi:putative phage-type endonuclease
MIHNVIQGSPEWFAVKCGKLSASRIPDTIATTKSGYSASRKNMLATLVCERMTKSVAESYSNSAMLRGVEKEPLARAEYETKRGVMVDQIGFVDHPDIAMSGASPDGIVDNNLLIEIKCPNTATHIETLTTGEIDKRYIVQMQWQMACTGATACDFISFDDRLPEGLQLFIKREHRNDEMIAMLEKEAKKFLEEVNETVEKLESIRNKNVEN